MKYLYLIYYELKLNQKAIQDHSEKNHILFRSLYPKVYGNNMIYVHEK